MLEDLAHGSLSGQTGLRGGDKDPNTLDGNDDAALVLFGNNALNGGVIFTGGLDIVPILNHVQALLGEGYNSFHVVDADYKGLDGIADFDQIFHLYGGIIAQFGYRNIPCMFGAKIHIDLGRGYPGYDACYLLSCI
ncbi:hypothetical protein SDC9_60788 [bioreactor metagenome]|uniref:Uncharacterized protein n=1 Tax=bioreactor metagenome TaxID=1076179 RepID=A0A644XDX2_9ZZZZ